MSGKAYAEEVVDMLNTPFAPWPSYSDIEIDRVANMLRSGRVNYWTGTECRDFEREFASWTACEYAVAVANGSLALELALKTLDIGPGDEVVVTPRSFIASASCVVLAGATPVFADIDRDTQNISAATIRPIITPKTKAIICVHLAGWPCDMDPILALASERGIAVIEDCAQAHGALYKGRPVGSIGDISAWSFCQDKIMTTGGEGGMITTNRRELWNTAWSYKDHGKSYDLTYQHNHPAGFRWLHSSFGTNWRMLEVQAVIGRIQLAKMPEWHAARRQNALEIFAACRDLQGIRCPMPPDNIEHAWYRYYVFVDPTELAAGWDRDRIVAEVVQRGVPCYQGSCSEMYKEAAFVNADLAPRQRLPAAAELGDTSLCFLVHPTLTREQISRTCDTIRAVMTLATGGAN